MRLRRETGDFSVVIDSENTPVTVRKNLGAEDLIGLIIKTATGRVMCVIAVEKESSDSEVLLLTCMPDGEDDSYSYTPSTGVLARVV